MQNRAVMCSAAVVAVTALVCCASLATAAPAASLFPDAYSAEDLELALPSFPLPPKRDRQLLRMPATVSLGEVSDFEADDTPRFRSVAAVDESDEQTDESEDEAEEAAQIEAEADAEVDAETEAEGESESEADSEAAAEETTEEVLSEELEDENGAVTPVVPAAAAAARFAGAGFNPAAMRFAQTLSRRYDSNLLPSGPLPVPPTSPSNLLAQVPVAAVGDALFTPIHNSERLFPGATPAVSLAGGVNNYAWPTLKRHANYAYGNTNWGAAVNTQFYPSPAPAAAAAAAPAAKPAAAKAEKKPAKADAEADAEAESSEDASEEGSFVELGEQQHQTLEQYMRTSAAAGVVYPYAPQYAPRNTPARNPAMDLARSGYQTYSRANWPSSVPPPPAYYLPPDVVV